MKKLLIITGSIIFILFLFIGAFVFSSWAPDRPVAELIPRWAPPPSIFIDVNDMNVHLRDEGPTNDPIPIVLLHGTSSSLHTWDGWARTLKENRRVVRFDMPGFGLTGPSPDNDYTLENYTRCVIAVLDTLQINTCVLAGNSLGGSIALNTVLSHPDRIDKLILVDSSGYIFKPASIPIGFQIAQIPVLNKLAANILPRRLIESSVKNVYGDPNLVTPELIDRYYDITTREGNRRALVQRFKQMSMGELASKISEIKKPTLIIWGGQDRLIPPGIAEQFHHDISGSQLMIYMDLGHVPQEEDPDQTVIVVEEFLGISR